MVNQLIRESTFGQIVRLASRRRLFQYPEEADPSIWRDFVHEKKSARMARYGATASPEPRPNNDDHDRSTREESGPDEREENEEQSRRKSSQDRGSREPQSASRSEGDSLASSQTQVVEPGSGAANQQRQGDSTSELEPDEKEGSAFNEFSGVKIDPEKGRDVDIVDWYGDNDPENPVNWSTSKKFFVTFEICLLTFAIYIGSAIYTAGLTDVTATFGVSEVAAEVGLTLFVFGYGVGPMFWSPMSEIPQIGRNPIYISTLLVFAILQIPTALTNNFGSLLFLRFITGFIGSPCLATGGASLADMYVPRKRAYAISIWGIAAVCGPTMGPLVGGFAAEAKGWRWTIWELCWLSGAASVVLFFLLPETSATNILYRRTSRLRGLSGNEKLKCEPEIEGEGMTAGEVVQMTLIRPITLNFLEPMVFALNMYIALIYGLLYIWFESFPLVFIQIYGFSLGLQGLAFLGILIGAFITIPPFFLYLRKVQEPKFDENGNIQPEKRLPPAIVGGVAVVVCLFWFGWSAGRTHWIMPIIGSAWFSVGAFLLFNAVLNYLPDAYPAYAASVLAGNDFMRSSFGAAFPLFARQMYEKLGVDWASSLLGFLAVCFVPIPIVLWMFGERLRKHHSKHARKDI